jgi:RNA-directed DNA polymerase
MQETVRQQNIFNELFDSKTLSNAFLARIRKKTHQYHQAQSYPTEMDDEAYFDTVSRKCANGRFRFSPYREQLISKGRHKLPRVISSVGLRDQVVQRQVTEMLQILFPESAKHPRGSRYIKEMIDIMASPTEQPLWIYRGDIQKFYDEIPRDQLMNLLAHTIQVPALLALIRHAIETPTVPEHTQRKDYAAFKRTKGVPQGLSFSGILANIFLHPVDLKVKQIEGIHYFRFVDDILILGTESQVKQARGVLEHELTQRQLQLHTQGADKEHLNQVSEPFAYLGYQFNGAFISVRTSSIDRLKRNIVNDFSSYKQYKSDLEANSEISPGVHEQNKHTFIELLNMRITGAISDQKTYGWLFYYRYITDQTLLHQLDALVQSMFKRHPEFNADDIKQVKKFSRAYFEIKHTLNTSTYIHRYETTLIMDELKKVSTFEEDAKDVIEIAVEPDPKPESLTPSPAEPKKDESIMDKLRLRAQVLAALKEEGYSEEGSDGIHPLPINNLLS